MRPKAKISQQKIATSLGVSQALVSIALNGRREEVNPEHSRPVAKGAVVQVADFQKSH